MSNAEKVDAMFPVEIADWLNKIENNVYGHIDGKMLSNMLNLVFFLALKKGEVLKEWKNTTWNNKPAIAIHKMKKRKLFGLFELEMEYQEIIDPKTQDTEHRELPWWNVLATD